MVPGKKFLLWCFVKNFQNMLCTFNGAIILSINIQVGLNMHVYDNIGEMARWVRPVLQCVTTNIAMDWRACNISENKKKKL